jgi:hypothetical protein
MDGWLVGRKEVNAVKRLLLTIKTILDKLATKKNF